MWEQAKLFVAMGEFCAKESWSFAPCHEFWVTLLYSALAIGALVMVLLWFARRWRIRAMRRATKALTREYLEAQRRVADELTMRQLRWKGDDIVAPEKDQAHITAEIRAALQSRKLNA